MPPGHQLVFVTFEIGLHDRLTNWWWVEEKEQVQEAVCPLIMELESAAESDMSVSAAAIDASKFFDHMEWDTTFGILRELGMPARVLKPMANHVFLFLWIFQAGSELWPFVARQYRALPRLLTHSGGRNGNCCGVGKIRSSLDPEATLATVIDDQRVFVSGPRSVE